MSREARDWAWERVAERPLSAAATVVLLRVAEWANTMDDGRVGCWHGVAKIAAASGRGERTVSRALTALEEAGLVVREVRADGVGRGRESDLIILPPAAGTKQPNRRHGQVDQPAKPAECSTGPTRQIDRTNPPIWPDQPAKSAASVIEDRKEPKGTESSHAPAPARETPTVDGRPVTDQEHATAGTLIRAFAAEAQQRFTADAWTDRVIRCLRAHPDLTQTDHLAILATAFRHPWWTGQPTPAVLYGTVAVFERQLAEWRGSVNAPAQQSYDHVIQEVAA